MRKFLREILPNVGYYAVLAISSDKIPRQKFFSNLNDLADYVEEHIETCDLYYATGTFKEYGSRKSDNVMLKKSFYLDVDCGDGKPYATQEEGIEALVKFVKTTALPRPTILSSGRGIHAYWILDKAVPPDIWQKIADKLNVLTHATGFNVDSVVTADAARVMRLPNTINQKNKFFAKVLTYGKLNNIIDLASVVAEAMHTKTPCEMGAPASVSQYPTRSTEIPIRGTKILDNVEVVQEFPPSNSHTIELKCAVIADAVKKPDEVSEPLWYKIVGLAAYTHEPEATAIRWSVGHKDYSEEATLRKMEQYKSNTSGAPLCASFANECKQCAKCPFRAKGITTPWALGIYHPEIKVDDGILPLEAPYKRTKQGIYITVDDVDIEICDFDIYPVRYGKDETVGAETVQFKWNRKNYGWTDLIFPNHLLFAQAARDFVVTVGGQGILLKTQSQTLLFQTMLRDYILKLRAHTALTNIYTSMGWKEQESTFVIGDTVFKRTDDGSVEEKTVTFNNGVSNTYKDLFSTAGSMQEWIDFTAVLEKTKLTIHQFALGVSFSAPLYAFTGLKGSVLSLYGETGGGKTLAQKWMQSIWGNPEALHYASSFTPNAVFHRMSLLGNLPMTIDEATKLGNDFMGDFVYTVTQGRDKARLNKLANEVAPRKWALPVVMSTNISLASKLSNMGFASDAQMFRLFELEVPVVKIFAKDSTIGRDIHNFLVRNHGHVGRAYIRHLLMLGQEQIHRDIENAIKEFPKKFNVKFVGTERYWEQLIVLAYLGLRYAKDAGLIKFPVETSINQVIYQLHLGRQVVEENKRDVFDLISAYCNEYVANSVTALYTDGVIAPSVDPSRIPRDSLYIRYNLHRPDMDKPFNRGQLIINANHLKYWLGKQGVDYKSFIRMLNDAGVNETPEVRSAARYSLGKNTPIKSGQVYAVRISMNHERLATMLDNMDKPELIDELLTLVPPSGTHK